MTAAPPLAGVLGWPIGHSRSPRLHGHWLARYRIEGYYVPIALPPVAAYAGLPVFGQSVQFTPGWNAAGLLVSNGLCMNLGF